MSEPETFPLIGHCRRDEKCSICMASNGYGYGRIPYEWAKKAYVGYAKKYPGSARDQSLERFGERGGFGHWEMTVFTGSEEWKQHFIPSEARKK